MKNKSNQEIEVRFLEINGDNLVARLRELGAQDLGEDLLKEIIFYDKDLTWQKSGKEYVRLRQSKNKTTLTYKNHFEDSVTGTKEIEFEVNDVDKAQEFLESVGLLTVREQEKRRHTFKLGEVTIDIDTWPKIPTYIELEADSEDKLKGMAEKLGLDWKDAVFENARKVIENHYNIPVGQMRYFTFERVE